MPAGSSRKREREYEKLKSSFEKEGRYKGREEEVAARIVNKQRRQFGETKAEQRKDREGKSPDRGLPIADYQTLTIREIEKRLGELSKGDLRKIDKYERGHKNRATLLGRIGKAMAEA